MADARSASVSRRSRRVGRSARNMLGHRHLTRFSSRISPVAGECVVELVGLEPTTRVLWNVGVSDQLTLSDTKHSSSKRPAIDGLRLASRQHGKSPMAAFFPQPAPPPGAYTSIGLGSC